MPIKEQTAEIMRQLGEGLVEPIAYDTAWLARVPQLNDLFKSTFPNAILWLREHQLKDGSRGSEPPLNTHGNTLSTLAVILALSHWNNPNDIKAIKL